VFLVLLKGHNKLYAMKVLTKEEMIQRNKVKRVMTEREILATVNHPFIVTMYASFQTMDRLCFVMEYCAGGEFFRVLQKQPKKRLKEDACRFYAAEGIATTQQVDSFSFVSHSASLMLRLLTLGCLPHSQSPWHWSTCITKGLFTEILNRRIFSCESPDTSR